MLLNYLTLYCSLIANLNLKLLFIIIWFAFYAVNLMINYFISCFLFCTWKLAFSIICLPLLLIHDLIVNQLTFINIFLDPFTTYFWLMKRKFDNEFSFSSFNNLYWLKHIFLNFYLLTFFLWFFFNSFLVLNNSEGFFVVMIVCGHNDNYESKLRPEIWND